MRIPTLFKKLATLFSYSKIQPHSQTVPHLVKQNIQDSSLNQNSKTLQKTAIKTVRAKVSKRK